MITKYRTREEWLTAAVEALTATLFAPEGHRVPAVRVSVGWPGGRGKKSTTIGQCWAPACAEDGLSQLFISPVLGDAKHVLATLVHEMAHAIDRNESGHKGAFRKIATSVGLTGAMTATVASDDLAMYLDGLVRHGIGAYPHAILSPTSTSSTPTQTTRMIKAICAEGTEDGETYTIRMTRKWIDLYGLPICPCHELRMEEA